MINDLYNKIFKDLNIKQKLLLSYFILIIIPLTAISFLSYTRSSTIIEKHMMEISREAMVQTNSFLTYKLKKAQETSSVLMMNNDVQEILKRDKAIYDIGQQIDDMKILEDFIRSLEINRDIFKIRLYVRDNLVYSNQRINFFNIDKIKNERWYKQAMSLKGQVLWRPTYSFKYVGLDKVNIISVVRLIRDLNNINNVIGLVSIDILEKDINSIITTAKFTQKGSTYIVDKNDNLVSQAGNNIKQLKIVNGFEKSNSDIIWKQGILNEKKVLVGSKEIDKTGWKLVSAIPVEEFLSVDINLRNYILLMMVIIGTLTYLIAYYISNSNTRRINQLVNNMRKVQEGDLDVEVPVDSTDEIGELEEDFNFMINRIKKLADEKYKMGLDVKNAELKALQAQINPHFLYNTLDLLNWMALDYDAIEISDILTTLARFYKLSLSKGKDYVTIETELQHVQIYVGIQNRRYKDRIKLIIDVDKEIYDYYILKIILQPLVENAILHGVMEKKNKPGIIKIIGYKDNNNVIIKIKDNGKGMSSEKLENIFNEESKDEHGYGVRNINERLKLNYGNNSGLSYKSQLEVGTIVTIKIPVQKDR